MIASVSYTANGAQDTFSVTFPYLTKADVDVYLNEVLKVLTTDYTWLSATQVKFNSVPVANTLVRVTRSTQTDPYVNFTDPGFLVEGDLDLATLQSLYIAEEAMDLVTKGLADITVTITGAGNVPGPLNPADNGKVLQAQAGTFGWQAKDITASQISDSTAAGRAIVTAADAAAQRSSMVAAKQYTPQTLTASNSVTIDASTGDYFKLTANTSFTLENPTNPTNGQRILLRILQDATGGRVISFGTAFRFGTDITGVILSTAANKTDYLGFVYDSTATKWDVIAFVKGY